MDGRTKLDGLQIARAFAALGIAYFHSWHVTMPFPPNTSYPIPVLSTHGWIAVDFFFAISGFVICMITTSANFRPLQFLVRRAFRLYPLWIATSLVYLDLTRYLGRGPQQTTGFFLYSLTLLPTNGFPFYDIGWSLQHEMMFYVIAAMVVPFFGLAGLIAALVAGIVADHLFALPWYLHQYFFYYANFLTGIAAFLVYRRTARLGAAFPIAAGFLALYLADSRDLYPIGLFCVLIGFLNLRAGSVAGKLGTLLGDASYSIYLLHPLVLYFVYIHLTAPLPPNWVQEPLRYSSLFAVVAISIFSWKKFEKPMIAIGARLTKRLESREELLLSEPSQ